MPTHHLVGSSICSSTCQSPVWIKASSSEPSKLHLMILIPSRSAKYSFELVLSTVNCFGVCTDPLGTISLRSVPSRLQLRTAPSFAEGLPMQVQKSFPVDFEMSIPSGIR